MEDGRDREAHPDALHALYARGRAAWPDVELDVATFTTHAARQLGDGASDDVRADDYYLAIACTAGRQRAISALDKHYLSTLVPALVRRGYDAATAADV